MPLVHDGSNIRLIDNALFWSFQSSSSNTSSFDAFNLQAIDGVVVLVVCPRVVSRVINSGSAPQTSRDVSHFRYKYCNCSPVVYLIDNFLGFRHVHDKGYTLTATRVFEDGCGTLTDTHVRATNGKLAGTRHEMQIATRSAGLMASRKNKCLLVLA